MMIYTKEFKNNFKISVVEAIRQRLHMQNKTQVSVAESMGISVTMLNTALNWDPSVSISVFRLLDIYRHIGGRIKLHLPGDVREHDYSEDSKECYSAALHNFVYEEILRQKLSIAEAARKTHVLRGAISSVKRGKLLKVDTLLDMSAYLGGCIEFKLY